MSKSLLAHLYSHIRGSQEDIATLSLHYILSQSSELNRAFTKRIASCLRIELDETLQYSCQVSGENGERPDMAGLSNSGSEQLLCEMKFYAGLTSNQPLAYIDRLKRHGGRGLIFICPVRRQDSLWIKLRESCADRKVNNVAEYCIDVDGIHLALTTWAGILDLMREVAASVAVEYISDIKQLEGFCAQMDSEAFIPFSASDLSAEVAVKSDRYYEVIDKTIQLFRSDDRLETSVKGLKATAYRKGYTRSIYVDEFAVSLNYDRDLWKCSSTEETPFWVSIRDKKWSQSGNMIKIYETIPTHKRTLELWNQYFIALDPLKDATLNEVCEDLKKQILKYIDLFRE